MTNGDGEDGEKISSDGMLSGRDDPGWKTWTETTQQAVKSLKVNTHPPAVRNDDNSSIDRDDGNPEDPTPRLLDSAANGAKLIVP